MSGDAAPWLCFVCPPQDHLEDGNRRRKTEATDANAQSSRSHAVIIGFRVEAVLMRSQG